MVIPSYFPLVGGAEKQLSGLANFLEDVSCGVTILTRILPGTLKSDIVSNVPVVRLKTAKFRFVFLFNLCYFLLRNRKDFDVIHVHTLNSPAIVSVFIGRLIRTPVIIKVTRSGKGCQLFGYSSSRLGRIIFRTLSMLATRFIAITNDVREELLSLKVGPKKIVQIPNGVNFPASNLLKKDKESNCTFLYVGRLIKRKRVDWLIKAFAMSNFDGSDRLVIIGSGSEMDSLVSLSADFRLDSSIEFMGEQDHDKVMDMLLLSDVFVLPSDSEGMSNALLEGMANNNAVIAANIPANRSLIVDGVNGLLFSTIEDLSECLCKARSSNILRASLSKNASNSVRENFSFEAVAKRYKDLYNSLI